MRPHGNTGTESVEADSHEKHSDRLSAALEFREHGLNIIPVGPSKRPFYNLPGRPRSGPGGVLEKVATSEALIGKVLRSLSRRPADEAEIRQWHALNPDCNFSAACGAPSGGLVVLDLDSADPEGCEMPPTPRVVTRRGSHIHLKTDRPIRSCDLYWNGEKIGHAIANGGYAPLPPSTHPDGMTYRWAEGLSPQELGWRYAEPPDWVMESCKRGESLTRRLDRSMKALRLPLMAATVYFFFALIHVPMAFWIGLPVALFGEMLQMWAASHLVKQSHLTTSGPYSFVRNPMYTGRFFVGLGCALMAWNPWLVTVYAAYFAVYACRRVAGEEERMSELHREDYGRYRAAVRRWIPRVMPYPDADRSRASWAKLSRNHEHRVALGLIVALAAIYLKLTFHPQSFRPF